MKWIIVFESGNEFWLQSSLFFDTEKEAIKEFLKWHGRPGETWEQLQEKGYRSLAVEYVEVTDDA